MNARIGGEGENLGLDRGQDAGDLLGREGQIVGRADPERDRRDAERAAPSPHLVELARAGKKIQAISELRRLTGASLMEAKDIVEGL